VLAAARHLGLQPVQHALLELAQVEALRHIDRALSPMGMASCHTA
jgi:hypothetical protein